MDSKSVQYQKMNKWLTSKLNDPYIKGIYSKPLLPLIYSGKYKEGTFYKYYNDNDIDIRNTDPLGKFIKYIIDNCPSEIDKNMNKLANVLEIYDDKIILLPPNSNQSHTNYLFKRLLDESENFEYNVPLISKTGKIINRSFPMIDKSFKNKFYKFCYDNSSHNRVRL